MTTARSDRYHSDERDDPQAKARTEDADPSRRHGADRRRRRARNPRHARSLVRASARGDDQRSRPARRRGLFPAQACRQRQRSAPAIIFHLARAGHRAAWLAAKAHARHVLNYEPNISAQVRSYLIDLMDLPEPAAPPAKDQIIDNLTRDIAIRVLVEQGRARWPWLPLLNSGATQRSVAHYVAAILSRRGMPMGERQVRKICQQRGTTASSN
jgi:hypothetical protein